MFTDLFNKLFPNRVRYRCGNDCQMKNAASVPASPIIQFLGHVPVKRGGKTYCILDMWNYTDTELERRHDYIQWLFPTDEPSDFSPNAPILSPNDLEIIRDSWNAQISILHSLKVMLKFYGFTFNIVNSNITQTNPEKWPPTPHNFLRITRILKCLNLCGLEDVAHVFYNALVSIPNLTETVPQTTLDCWHTAVGADEERGMECPHFDIPALIQKSDYVQAKCINEQWRGKYGDDTTIGWNHSLPLKNPEGHYLDPDNWDLSEAEKAEIQANTESLCEYAQEMISLCRRAKKAPGGCRLNAVTDFLPPWIVFPLYHATSLGWRMGIGEDYRLAHWDFIDALMPENLALYEAAYPRPCYYEGVQFIRREEDNHEP